eukprot:Rhum_TRINITY_DN14154_c9_g1::Rhum_TRINITY_DN14154_c9_g1_i1::g.70988::m.70988
MGVFQFCFVFSWCFFFKRCTPSRCTRHVLLLRERALCGLCFQYRLFEYCAGVRTFGLCWYCCCCGCWYCCGDPYTGCCGGGAYCCCCGCCCLGGDAYTAWCSCCCGDCCGGGSVLGCFGDADADFDARAPEPALCGERSFSTIVTRVERAWCSLMSNSKPFCAADSMASCAFSHCSVSSAIFSALRSPSVFSWYTWRRSSSRRRGSACGCCDRRFDTVLSSRSFVARRPSSCVTRSRSSSASCLRAAHEAQAGVLEVLWRCRLRFAAARRSSRSCTFTCSDFDSVFSSLSSASFFSSFFSRVLS